VAKDDSFNFTKPTSKFMYVIFLYKI